MRKSRRRRAKILRFGGLYEGRNCPKSPKNLAQIREASKPPPLFSADFEPKGGGILGRSPLIGVHPQKRIFANLDDFLFSKTPQAPDLTVFSFEILCSEKVFYV